MFLKSKKERKMEKIDFQIMQSDGITTSLEKEEVIVFGEDLLLDILKKEGEEEYPSKINIIRRIIAQVKMHPRQAKRIAEYGLLRGVWMYSQKMK